MVNLGSKTPRKQPNAFKTKGKPNKTTQLHSPHHPFRHTPPFSAFEVWKGDWQEGSWQPSGPKTHSKKSSPRLCQLPWSSIPWCFDIPWSFVAKEIPWYFEPISASFACFSRFLAGLRGVKNLGGVLGRFPWLILRKTRENTPHGRLTRSRECRPKVPQSAGLPFPVPNILEFVAFGNPGKIFQQFSRDFPTIFLQNSPEPLKYEKNCLAIHSFCLTVLFFPHQISLVGVFPQTKGLN